MTVLPRFRPHESNARGLWSRREIFHHARLSDYITDSRSIVTQFYTYLKNYNPVFTDGVVTRVIDRAVEQQAFMLSTNDLSWLAAWMFLLMIPMIFLCKKVKQTSTAAPQATH